MAKLTSLEGPLEVNTPARQFIQRQAYNPLAGIGQALVTTVTEAGKDRAAAMKELAAQQDAQRNKIAMGAIASSVDSTNAMLDKAMQDGVLDNNERVRILSHGRNETFRTLGTLGIEPSSIAAYMNQYDKSTFQVNKTEEKQISLEFVQQTDSFGNVSNRAANAAEMTTWIMHEIGGTDPNAANMIAAALSGRPVMLGDKPFTDDMAMAYIDKHRASISDFNSQKTAAEMGTLTAEKMLPVARNHLNTTAELVSVSLIQQGYGDWTKYTPEQFSARLQRALSSELRNSDTFATYETADGSSSVVKNKLNDEIPVIADRIAKNYASITNGDSPLYNATREVNNAIHVATISGDPAVLDDLRERYINRIRRTEGLEGLGAGMIAALSSANINDLGIEYSRIVSGQDLDSPDKLMLYRISTLSSIEDLSYQEGVMEAMPTQSPLYKSAMTGFIGHLNRYVTSLEAGTPSMSPREVYRYTSLLLKNDRATGYLSSGEYEENGQELLGLITKVRDSARNMINARIDPTGTTILNINKEVEEYSRGASDKRKAAEKED